MSRNPLDIIDTDPVRLAARSLVAHIRAEQYADSLLPAGDYVWESDEAVEAVLKFLKDHAK